MGVSAYYAAAIPYYWQPFAPAGKPAEEDIQDTMRLMPSVKRLVQEYQRLRAVGFGHARALAAVRAKDPEAAPLLGEVLNQEMGLSE